MSIGENIKRLRKEHKLTQKKLGELSGISEAMIRQYELGLRKPKMISIIKIAVALNVEFDEIAEIDNITQIEKQIYEKNRYFEKELIAKRLGVEELLTAVAEEASELAQASLKLRRALNGKNYTPKTYHEVLHNFAEEIADVELCIEVLLFSFCENDCYIINGIKKSMKEKKVVRWFDRLKRNPVDKEVSFYEGKEK